MTDRYLGKSPHRLESREEFAERNRLAGGSKVHPIVAEPEIYAEILYKNPKAITLLNRRFEHDPPIDFFEDWDPYGDPSSSKRGNTPGKSSASIHAQQNSLPMTRSVDSMESSIAASSSRPFASAYSSAKRWIDASSKFLRRSTRAFTSSRMRLASSNSMPRKSTPMRVTGGEPFTGTAEEHEALMREAFKGEAK